MSKEIVDRVRALAEPILSDERMELVEIRIPEGGPWMGSPFLH